MMRAGKDVAQLRRQSKQSIDPLVVEDDCTNAQGGPINKEALQDFMHTIGLTPQQLIGGGSIPTTNFDIYRPMSMAGVLSTLSPCHHWVCKCSC